jgi:2-hydroxyglutarate dehydrogenase
VQFTVTPDKRVVIRGVEPGQIGPAKHVIAKHVITCGGFHADRVSVLAGGKPEPKVVAFRGTYYQMVQPFKDIVRTNVYPVPSGGGIPVGVHFTPTVNERRGHQMIVGPGACLAFSKEGYRFRDVSLCDLWDYATNGGLWKFALSNPRLSIGEIYRDLNKRAFLSEAQKLVPALTEDMVEESFAGVMAQVFTEDGTAAKDYIFERGCLQGTTLNVRNAPSPACTASLAIAEHVVDTAAADFGWLPKN